MVSSSDFKHLSKDFIDVIERNRKSVVGDNKIPEDWKARDIALDLILQYAQNGSVLEAYAGDSLLSLALAYKSPDMIGYLSSFDGNTGKDASQNPVDTEKLTNLHYDSLKTINQDLGDIVRHYVEDFDIVNCLDEKEILDKAYEIMPNRSPFDLVVLMDMYDTMQSPELLGVGVGVGLGKKALFIEEEEQSIKNACFFANKLGFNPEIQTIEYEKENGVPSRLYYFVLEPNKS